MNTEFWWNNDECGEVIKEETVSLQFVYHKPTCVDTGATHVTTFCNGNIPYFSY
jgi:hypothetical protein